MSRTGGLLILQAGNKPSAPKYRKIGWNKLAGL